MKRLLFCGLVILICLPALAQQTDINRYTLFTGFDYMISPARNLTERGFETDFGVTVRPWLGLGGDFGILGDGIISGAGTISGGETIYAPVLLQVPPPFGPINPNSIHVPIKSQTYTFAAGPQFYLRKWEKVTFLARPGFGGIHEKADISFPATLPGLFQLLNIPVPAARQTDTQLFFGLGGGFDLNVSRKIGVRFAADWVNTHLFSNLLVPRQNYVRFSVGPTFRWGHLK
jgi:outer membrane protein with beta-barrel domain